MYMVHTAHVTDVRGPHHPRDRRTRHKWSTRSTWSAPSIIVYVIHMVLVVYAVYVVCAVHYGLRDPHGPSGLRILILIPSVNTFRKMLKAESKKHWKNRPESCQNFWKAPSQRLPRNTRRHVINSCRRHSAQFT